MSQLVIHEDEFQRFRDRNAQLANLMNGMRISCKALFSLKRRNDLQKLQSACLDIARHKHDETPDLSAADYREQAIKVMQKTIEFLQAGVG